MRKYLDMDGNELKVGDIVLFGTGAKTIARARIIKINDYGYLELHTLKNRRSNVLPQSVLLDFEYKARLLK